MKILLVGTYMPQSLFDDCLKRGIRLNPAGQNFYFRLHRALKNIADVDVVSLIPSLPEKPEVPHFTLVERVSSKINPFASASAMKKAYLRNHKNEEVDFVVYDSLNLQGAKAAKALARRFGAKLIPVLTDDPQNITGVSKTYIRLCLAFSKNGDGYFALPPKLGERFNAYQARVLLFPGIVEEKKKLPAPVEGDFFYYGGALFEKDGVGSLVRAYIASKSPVPLLLSGHGEMEAELKELSRTIPGLHFLGQISKDENAAYQQHATLVINPRWYNEELEQVSVPSKDLEYLANATKIAATPCDILERVYRNSIYWLPKTGEEIEKALTEIFQTKASFVPENHSQTKIQKEIGYESIGKGILAFLESLR